MDCLIAWDVWDQTGKYAPRYVDCVEALVRTCYDPDFTPDNEDGAPEGVEGEGADEE